VMMSSKLSSRVYTVRQMEVGFKAWLGVSHHGT